MGLTKAAAKEMAHHEVRINARPGEYHRPRVLAVRDKPRPSRIGPGKTMGVGRRTTDNRR